MKKAGKIILAIVLIVVVILLFLVIFKVLGSSSSTSSSTPSSTSSSTPSSTPTYTTVPTSTNPSLNPSIPTTSVIPAKKQCSDYTSTDKNLPVECYKLLWQQAGCTSELPEGNVGWWAAREKSAVAEDMNLYATTPTSQYTSICYNDACRVFKAGDKIGNIDCYNQLWKSVGCTTAIPPENAKWYDGQPRSVVESDMKLWATLNSNIHKKGCYGI